MSDLQKRFREARDLLRRIAAAMDRKGWEDGENERDVYRDILDFLCDEKIRADFRRIEKKAAKEKGDATP